MEQREDLIIKLTEGYSSQSKQVNNIWVVLMIVSIFGLTGQADDKGKIALPFTLGQVSAGDFYTISIVLLSVIMIAFSSAVAQTIRTWLLIQKKIDSYSKDEFVKYDMKDVVNSLAIFTYNRVSSISYLLSDVEKSVKQKIISRIIILLKRILYLVLKIFTFAFLYFLPIRTIIYCLEQKSKYRDIGILSIPHPVILSLAVLAILSVVMILINDIVYMTKAIRKI